MRNLRLLRKMTVAVLFLVLWLIASIADALALIFDTIAEQSQRLADRISKLE